MKERFEVAGVNGANGAQFCPCSTLSFEPHVLQGVVNMVPEICAEGPEYGLMNYV